MQFSEETNRVLDAQKTYTQMDIDLNQDYYQLATYLPGMQIYFRDQYDQWQEGYIASVEGDHIITDSSQSIQTILKSNVKDANKINLVSAALVILSQLENDPEHNAPVRVDLSHVMHPYMTDINPNDMTYGNIGRFLIGGHMEMQEIFDRLSNLRTYMKEDIINVDDFEQLKLFYGVVGSIAQDSSNADFNKVYEFYNLTYINTPKITNREYTELLSSFKELIEDYDYGIYNAWDQFWQGFRFTCHMPEFVVFYKPLIVKFPWWGDGYNYDKPLVGELHSTYTKEYGWLYDVDIPLGGGYIRVLIPEYYLIRFAPDSGGDIAYQLIVGGKYNILQQDIDTYVTLKRLFDGEKYVMIGTETTTRRIRVPAAILVPHEFTDGVSQETRLQHRAQGISLLDQIKYNNQIWTVTSIQEPKPIRVFNNYFTNLSALAGPKTNVKEGHRVNKFSLGDVVTMLHVHNPFSSGVVVQIMSERVMTDGYPFVWFYYAVKSTWGVYWYAELVLSYTRMGVDYKSYLFQFPTVPADPLNEFPAKTQDYMPAPEGMPPVQIAGYGSIGGGLTFRGSSNWANTMSFEESAVEIRNVFERMRTGFWEPAGATQGEVQELVRDAFGGTEELAQLEEVGVEMANLGLDFTRDFGSLAEFATPVGELVGVGTAGGVAGVYAGMGIADVLMVGSVYLIPVIAVLGIALVARTPKDLRMAFTAGDPGMGYDYETLNYWAHMFTGEKTKLKEEAEARKKTLNLVSYTYKNKECYFFNYGYWWVGTITDVTWGKSDSRRQLDLIKEMRHSNRTVADQLKEMYDAEEQDDVMEITVEYLLNRKQVNITKTADAGRVWLKDGRDKPEDMVLGRFVDYYKEEMDIPFENEDYYTLGYNNAGQEIERPELPDKIHDLMRPPVKQDVIEQTDYPYRPAGQQLKVYAGEVGVTSTITDQYAVAIYRDPVDYSGSVRQQIKYASYTAGIIAIFALL